MTSATKSLWHATHQVRHFPPLNHDLAVDAAIIGGGVSGVTAVLLLARAGKRVTLWIASAAARPGIRQVISRMDCRTLAAPPRRRMFYVATGFSGNGITFGTIAATIVTEQIRGLATPYDALFDATRVASVASAVGYFVENVTYPIHLLKDRLTSLNTDDGAPDDLAPGEGAVFSSSEGKIAVCRDVGGKFHVVSAVCTHLACEVAWNKAEQTWDCRCHGSRFSPDGKVMNGPAVTDLRPVPIYAIQTTQR